MSVQRRSFFLALCAATLALGFGTSAGGTASGDLSPYARHSTVAGPVAEQGVQVDPKVVAAVKISTFIFDGTVVDPDEVSARAGGQNVLVRQVFAEALAFLVGHRVIVVPPPRQIPGPSQRAVFFTYGRSISTARVLQEVYRAPVSSDSAMHQVLFQIAAADSVLRDSTILKVSNEADAVALVRVDSVFPVITPDSVAASGSEHAPKWARVVGRVMSTFRPRDSSLVNQRITTLISEGENAPIANPPELHVNETWILWLTRTSRLSPALRPGIDTTGIYFIFAPEYVGESTDSARVARLLTPPKNPATPPAGGLK
jgi:hypothetical protein